MGNSIPNYAYSFNDRDHASKWVENFSTNQYENKVMLLQDASSGGVVPFRINGLLGEGSFAKVYSLNAVSIEGNPSSSCDEFAMKLVGPYNGPTKQCDEQIVSEAVLECYSGVRFPVYCAAQNIQYRTKFYTFYTMPRLNQGAHVNGLLRPFRNKEPQRYTWLSNVLGQVEMQLCCFFKLGYPYLDIKLDNILYSGEYYNPIIYIADLDSMVLGNDDKLTSTFPYPMKGHNGEIGRVSVPPNGGDEGYSQFSSKWVAWQLFVLTAQLTAGVDDDEHNKLITQISFNGQRGQIHEKTLADIYKLATSTREKVKGGAEFLEQLDRCLILTRL